MDGISHSDFGNQILLNKEWHGLMIEPIKIYYDKLVNNFQRENIHFENVAIDSTNRNRKMFFIDPSYIIDGHVPYWADGISSFYLDRNELKNLSQYTKEINVNCRTIKFIFEKYNVLSIDNLLIDTEGHDLIIMKDIFNYGILPKKIIIEYVNLLDSEKSELFQLMKKYNYLYDILSEDIIACLN